MNLRMSMAKLAQLYIEEIVRLHRIPGNIVSDRDSRSTSRFWQTLWNEVLPLVEFTYNNSYQASIGMTPYEALYGRRCRTPLCWYQDGESMLVGPKLLRQTTKKVQFVKDRLQASQSRQKAYADRRRRPLEFVTGDHVFLRLANLPSVFHVSQLRKYVFDPSHVLEAEDVHFRKDLTVEVQLVGLKDRRVKELKGRTITLVKVIWDRRTGYST
ncbi:uncharacterized protein LOC114170372 [Vigna unguiculata]|uniref:uncharacterized protein LOC114170372 n=1 Tax=Vigna unguiculata TaxID=3917 RepID=UPI001016A11B|nr:uncharacterized protein LOC114170372 [Vigna unguiculata]